MGEFNGKISAEFTPPKSWELNRSLAYTTDDLTESEIDLLKEVGANIIKSGKITCRKGMKTDLASVPRIVWNLIAPWDVARAAVIHDHLYAVLRNYYNKDHGVSNNWQSRWAEARAISDKVFLLGMQDAEPTVPKWKIYSAYWSVRVFGSVPASKNDE